MILALNIKKHLPWLQDLPEGWKYVRLRELFTLSDERSEDDLPEVLSLTMRGIVKRDISNNEGQLAESYSGYKKIFPNDIVFNPMDLLSGYVAKSDFEGVISPAYSVIRPIKNIDLGYFTYYFQTHYHLRIFHPFGKGVSLDHRWELKDKDLLNFPIAFPPFGIQQKISRYLNSKIKKIDKFVISKSKFIELLKEQKQAVINRSVTKGIKAEDKMKPSGIDWLGDIPIDWKLQRIKTVISQKRNGSWGANPGESIVDAPCVRVADFDYSNLRIIDEIQTIRGYKEDEFQSKKLSNPCILIEKSGGGEKTLVGRIVCWDKEIDAICSNFIAQLKVNSEIIDLRYFALYMSFLYSIRLNFKHIKATTGIQNIDQYQYFSEVICLPNLQEQRNIVQFIKNENKLIDKAIQKAEQQIQLIKEYKTSLIANAVMGQLEIKD